MKIRERIRMEKKKLPMMMKGYSRSMVNAWVRATQKDEKAYRKDYKRATIRAMHEKGYLMPSMKRYDLRGEPALDYITDFDYLYLQPFNSSLSKWLEDIITTNRVLKDHAEHCRKVYYSIVQRDGRNLVFRADHEDREYLGEDMLETVREQGFLELRPASWDSSRDRYTLEYVEDELLVNGYPTDTRMFKRSILNRLEGSYVLAEKVSMQYTFSSGETADHSLKLWMANDCGDGPKILFATISIYWNEGPRKVRRHATLPFDIETGSFVFEEETITVPGWDTMRGQLLAVSGALQAISYYTCTISLQQEGGFKFLHFSGSPSLPEVAFGAEMNDYLKAKLERRKAAPKPSFSSRWKKLKDMVVNKLTGRLCRRGMRPYMRRLWIDSVISDFLHTKGLSLGKKIWCWKRGYMSYRSYQYGLTEENYKHFLSDYDYHYLNRINNDYQKWINDKTTTRLILEPFKEYVPDYYFSIFNRNGETEIATMWDCPEGIPASFDGLFEMLRTKGILAMKPSAGTHGDGFYCLTYENGAYTVNGEIRTEEQIIELITGFKSFYIVTEYIVMHDWLKEIYGKSVNTIRVMVINRKGYNPKIMQTYMRIGSSRTGFTDNVGYGGICCMVNKETGELYQPETIKDHKFYDCPNHPDTGTPISGFLPNWDLVCEKVKEISAYLCELEYLGFDIAITQEGFYLLEINIHQDLHKVALFDDEMLGYFHEKIVAKRRIYG